MGAGRKRKYNSKEVQELVNKLDQYINETDIPILAEFAYQNDITRQTLYDYAEFSTLIKKAIDKKEAQLEKLTLMGKVNTTMAVFSLKQLGWKDKVEQKINLNMNELTDDEIDQLLEGNHDSDL